MGVDIPNDDHRSPARRALDEALASEPMREIPTLPPNTPFRPIEAVLRASKRPSAVPGVVENGVVRPLDPTVKLVEHAQVLIVTS